MNNQKATIWGYTGQRWIKRRLVILSEDRLSCADLDTLNEYDKKFGGHHSYLPTNIDPNNHTVLNQMRCIAEKNVNHHLNDFFHIDTHLYFKYNQDVIWMTREAGTNMYPALSYQSKLQKESCTTSLNYYLDQKRGSNKLYQVHMNQVKPIKQGKVIQILENLPITEETA
ncbi:hypothetical protein ASD24_24620 [Paenibacillus sp. Root52]|uniref:hypothetical protein n=1 Tax=Paenibacillus sp. Root52 TaxID=1736552 RepID=UPI0006F2146F|nr:hypothetical protein [Paenibacillus sp. Root52]KQY90983.1 hypothetical protein ASD24_24620 [Paenibacillus sp. Root52]